MGKKEIISRENLLKNNYTIDNILQHELNDVIRLIDKEIKLHHSKNKNRCIIYIPERFSNIESYSKKTILQLTQAGYEVNMDFCRTRQTYFLEISW